MFEPVVMNHSSKQELYRELAEQARHLVMGEPDDIANLSNISALLNLHLADINWVGFYLWHNDTRELVLGPFQGKPACIRIGQGKGVCGTAVSEKRTVLVDDVLQFPGHIACDAASRSEIVVPLIQSDEVVGVLDIDSPHPGRFDADDGAGLERVVSAVLAEMRVSPR